MCHHHGAITALLLTTWSLLSVKTSAYEITASDKIPGEQDASSKSTFSNCYSGVHRQQPTWRIALSKCQGPTHYLLQPTSYCWSNSRSGSTEQTATTCKPWQWWLCWVTVIKGPPQKRATIRCSNIYIYILTTCYIMPVSDYKLVQFMKCQDSLQMNWTQLTILGCRQVNNHQAVLKLIKDKWS